MHLRNSRSQTTNLMSSLNVQVAAYGRQTVDDRGVVRSCDPLQLFGAPVITGTAEPKVVNFRMTYHQQKGRGYGHVTVL